MLTARSELKNVEIKIFAVTSLYFTGRFDDSQVLSELVYLASNLLVLLNDNIFRQTVKVAKNFVSIVPSHCIMSNDNNITIQLK